ncbi:MAG: hypothetical protein ACD_78C00146G0002 [uncultured bacterium (gcode 4)]|uniref:Uncharacterized protein n=1 Tax=uncultured bacterium (gcode 4) TaxID=1234023 RepID=K1YD24_9BACT|nr:MAG: hypothetical protein ACD_78C00146G0002 [uncultured bacterium (gcode 4)]
MLFECCFAGPIFRTFDGEWSIEKTHHRVSDIFIECPVIANKDIGHLGKIFLHEREYPFRSEFFRNGRKGRNIGEKDRNLPFFSPESERFRILSDSTNYFRSDIVRESTFDIPPVFIGDEELIHITYEKCNTSEEKERKYIYENAILKQYSPTYYYSDTIETKNHNGYLCREKIETHDEEQGKEYHTDPGGSIRKRSKIPPLKKRIEHIRMELNPRHAFRRIKRTEIGIMDQCSVFTDKNSLPLENLRINLSVQYID